MRKGSGKTIVDGPRRWKKRESWKPNARTKNKSGAWRTCGEEKESNDGQRRKRALVEKTRKLLEEEQREVTGGGYEWQM